MTGGVNELKNTHSDIDSILIDYWDALNRIAQTHSSQQSLEEALQRNSQALEDSLLALLGATSDEDPVERDALSQMTPGIARGNPMTAGGGGDPHVHWITTKTGKRIPIRDGEAGGGGMRPDGSAAAGGPGGPPAEPQFEKAKIKGWDVDLPPIPEPLMNAIGPKKTLAWWHAVAAIIARRQSVFREQCPRTRATLGKGIFHYSD